MFIFQRSYFEHVYEYIDIVFDNNLMKYKAQISFQPTPLNMYLVAIPSGA